MVHPRDQGMVPIQGGRTEVTPLERAGGGTFEDFYRATARELRRYAHAVAGSGIADDACQEAWLRMWRAWGSAHDERLQAWARRVVHNCCIDDLRRRRPTSPVLPDEPDLGRGPDDIAVDRSEAAAVAEHFSQLPVGLRQALWLREVVGLTYAEIADALGIPIGTVMSRLHAARRKLARKLDRSTGPPAPEERTA